MTYTEVLLRQEPMGGKSTWTPETLGFDQGGFQCIIQRLFEIEAAGKIRIISTSRVPGDSKLVASIRFERLS